MGKSKNRNMSIGVGICPACGRAHSARKSCEEVEREKEEIKNEVEHHKQHCEGCSNSLHHVLNLRQMRKKEPPIFG